MNIVFIYLIIIKEIWCWSFESFARGVFKTLFMTRGEGVYNFFLACSTIYSLFSIYFRISLLGGSVVCNRRMCCGSHSPSAGSFAGLGFLAWYLAGKLKAFDRKGHIAKLCIVFLPLLVASLVAVSRVDDYWHHWQDVFAGGIIGLLFWSLSLNHLEHSRCQKVCMDLVSFFFPLFQVLRFLRFVICSSSHIHLMLMVRFPSDIDDMLDLDRHILQYIHVPLHLQLYGPMHTSNS